MKKNKGFTLIELLAIIVILAIIAVITVPIILNVIDNAKRGTAKDSAYGYKDAINKYYVAGMLEDESIKLSGEYNVVDGKLGEYDIPFSGTKPTSGYLTFENNALTSGCLTIDEYKVTFDKGEVTDVEVGECGNISDNPDSPSEPETPIEPVEPQVTYKCKRADITTLHTEECTQTSDYCFNDGYTLTGSKGKTTITYGNSTVTQGKLTSGDAYDCDVNGDGTYDPQTERFYYVSDLYDTKTKEYNNNYAVLLYYNGTKNGLPNNTSDSLIKYYNGTYKCWNGPGLASDNLPKITEWTNFTLSSTSRAIVNESGGNNAFGPDGEKQLPTSFNYYNKAARLLTRQEVSNSCYNDEVIEQCNFMYENTQYSSSSIKVRGFWLENVSSGNYDGASTLIYNKFSTGSCADYNSSYYNVRPAIEVLKTDIEI